MADIINNVDLADDHTWKKIAYELGPGETWDGSMWSPPCSTFSRARNAFDGGPRPLRGQAVPELLGLPGLDLAEKEKVRIGTLLANRAGEGIAAQDRGGKPWILENPPEEEDGPSLFNVPKIADAVAQGHKARFPQCSMGAPSTKLSEWRSKLVLTDVPDQKCQHPRRWWRRLPGGQWSHRSHPPLKGKFRCVQQSEWLKLSKEERTKPEPEYLTRAAAAYPSMLNCYLACQLVPAAIAAHRAAKFERVGSWGNALVRSSTLRGLPRSSGGTPVAQTLVGVSKHQEGQKWSVLPEEVLEPKRGPHMCEPLRHVKPVDKQEQNKMAIGGMRKPQVSIEKIPTIREFGKKMHDVLNNFLDKNPQVEKDCLKPLGVKNESEGGTGPSEQRLNEARKVLAELLDVDNIESVSNGDFHTEIRADLLSGWSAKASDPDKAVIDWLRNTGVPAGLRRHPEDNGIFPRLEPSPQTLEAECPPEEFTPYSSVEEDDDAWKEILRLTDKKWLKQFSTLDELRTYLGEDPVLSRFGLIIKIRYDKVKKRLILDSKQSGVSQNASKLERVILPRILDAALDILAVQSAGDEVEVMVLDFSDAFWLLPLAPEERKWFTSRIRGSFFVFLRNAQGSRNAPLGWGRLAALIGRATQSMFDKNRLRLEIYTDDPIVAVGGNKKQRDRCLAIVILLWRCFGFPLSWHKSSRGKLASWIGADYKILENPVGVSVRIKQDTFDDAREMVNEMLTKNVVSLKELRTATGKLSNISNLLMTWRPFMKPLYAALYDATPVGCPVNCRWTRQFKPSLEWFRTFFVSSGGFVEREFRLDAFRGTGTKIQFVLDASPWGIAGILYVNDVATEFFSDALDNLDEILFEHPIGSACGQQVWESLAALVAIRVWLPYWDKKKAVMHVRGDSVAMLTLVVNMRPKSKALVLLGQELAITMASSSFIPTVAEHIPGIANVAADKLSRWFQPGTPQELPLGLEDVPFIKVPRRNKDYYVTLKGSD